MEIPSLKIGDYTAKVPIIQGGMGVRISLSSLSSAVANEGGIGTISSMGLGDFEHSKKDLAGQSREGLLEEIAKAKAKTDGLLAVNVMGVLSNADDLISSAVKAGINIIIYGAGLPVKLPQVVPDPSVSLVPIISSARVANIIAKMWDKKFNRIPDAYILEGPLAGGHLGYSLEQLNNPAEFNLDKILLEVLEAIKPYEDKYGKKIPIIAAGGIYDGQDIARVLKLGASGVQLGTRFVCTDECDASDAFKQSYIDAKEGDTVIIKSPVGMPGRALNNVFLQNLAKQGKVKVACPYRCLTVCKMDDAAYCIAKALIHSTHGDLEHGLIFSGVNSPRIKKIVPTKELIDELVEGIRQA